MPSSDEDSLIAVTEGVWVATAPVSIVGTKLTSTMTVLRLGDGGLVVHSPIALTPERRAAVEALGPVRHLYAPNTFHHLRVGDWSAAFPSARVHGARGLSKKRPDLRIDRTNGEPEPAFAGVLDEVHVDGFRLDETALFHRPSQTLVVADLVHNVGRPEGSWTRFYAKTMGFYDRVGLSRVLRWTAFSDKVAARKSIDALLSLPIERLVVGHGAPVVADARQALGAAYEWIPKAS
jgi:hypothetical protein